MRLDLLPFTAPTFKPTIRYITNVEEIPQLSDEEKERLRRVGRRYAFRVNDYYLSLINWDDPNDPIRQLIIPREDELDDRDSSLDPCNEASNTVARGVQHKYPDTVLLLANETCGGNCRYCFRKRLFMQGNNEASVNVNEGIHYIAQHPEVSNVLLTGGDPLLLSARRLGGILAALREIPHVQVIRIGSKMPAFNPWRILADKDLRRVLRQFSTPFKRIYLMAHFDHPRELTNPAIDALDRLIRNGVICANQCPLIRGVNDDPAVLSELFRKLSWVGAPPYYLFQCRPTAGNRPYGVPIVRGWEIFRQALRRDSGLARRARYVMSHETGKIEILGVDEKHIYLRYQRAKDPNLRGRFLICKRNDQAYWLDDLEKIESADMPLLPPTSCLSN